MNKTKRFATVIVILTALLVSIFFLMYQDHEYTFVREERIKATSNLAREEVNKTIYRALKREAQTKVDRVAKDIRSEVLEEYGGKMNQYHLDYDNYTSDSDLIEIIDRNINSKENRFYYVESNSNDMFVMSELGVLVDKSEGYSAHEEARDFETEISMHFNKDLAEQAVDAITNMDVNKKDIFWRFKNTTGTEDPGLTNMNINEVLKLPLNELRDYEFLTVAYIDRYSDVTGKQSVVPTGHKQDTRRLAVVQGFSLYEHIQEDFRSSYMHIDKNEQLQLEIVEESRRELVTRMFFMMIIIFVSFISMAAMHNSCIKGRVGDDGKR